MQERGSQARVLPMGEAAVLIEVDDIESVMALRAALLEAIEAAQEPWADVEDVVPAARTLLIRVPMGTDLRALGQSAIAIADKVTSDPESSAERTPTSGDHDTSGVGSSGVGGSVIDIPVTYDGADLSDVAAATGMSESEVIEAHGGTLWRVAFFGFSPGFAYLTGGDSRLQVPRRDEPRTSVPPGSVGLAGEFSAVYPRESPGGWQLIGRSDTVMWDQERDPPSHLQPGSVVRFVQASGAASQSPQSPQSAQSQQSQQAGQSEQSSPSEQSDT